MFLPDWVFRRFIDSNENNLSVFTTRRNTTTTCSLSEWTRFCFMMDVITYCSLLFCFCELHWDNKRPWQQPRRTTRHSLNFVQTRAKRNTMTSNTNTSILHHLSLSKHTGMLTYIREYTPTTYMLTSVLLPFCFSTLVFSLHRSAAPVALRQKSGNNS